MYFWPLLLPKIILYVIIMLSHSYALLLLLQSYKI